MTLVALRLTIGWHFYQEGVTKQRDGKFSSRGFLSAAKGPFAPFYQGMIWDADGYYRLNQQDTLATWDQFRERAANHFGFEPHQMDEAEGVYRDYELQLRTFLDANHDDIEEYFDGLERRDRYRGRDAELDSKERRANRAWTEVPSLRGQLGQIEGELIKKRDGWLRTIDSLWEKYEHDINAIAYDDQPGAYLRVERLGRRAMDSVSVDRFIPYFDMAVGALLILGLFTRVAACAGAAFLATVILTQWPLASDAAPTFYQSVELISLLVLAATAAGRFAGLDYLLYVARLKCCPPKKES